MGNLSYEVTNTELITKKTNNIGIQAKTLSIYFILTTCGLYIFPPRFTNLIKPLFIYFLLLEIIMSKKSLEFQLEQYLSLFLASYFFLIFIKTGINSSNIKGFASLFLNLVFFCLATLIDCNQKEISLLIDSLYYAGFIFSLIVAVSNPIIGNNISRMNIYYFKSSLNANGIPYFIVPSVVIGVKKLFEGKYRIGNKLMLLFALLIMLYTIFYTGTRGAILALLISLSLLLFKNIVDNIRFQNILNMFLVFIFSFFIILIILNLLPDNILNRTLKFSSYNLNSRDQLWRLAISLSKNNFYFGNGFDYWTQNTGYSYGAHNLYIDLLVSSGIVGSLLMLSLVCIISLKSRNVFLLSLLTAPIMNSMFESGRTYDFWNPLILCVLIYSSNYYKSKNSKEIIQG